MNICKIWLLFDAAIPFLVYAKEILLELYKD